MQTAPAAALRTPSESRGGRDLSSGDAEELTVELSPMGDATLWKKRPPPLFDGAAGWRVSRLLVSLLLRLLGHLH